MAIRYFLILMTLSCGFTNEWYGENKKPHKRFLREAIVNNVAMNTFPNFLKKGIVIAHTNLRRLPTNRPGFDVYSKAGEGYPFDYFQETNLWANTPLQLLHLSNDKQWCYVISPYYIEGRPYGWGGNLENRDCSSLIRDFLFGDDIFKVGNGTKPIPY